MDNYRIIKMLSNDRLNDIISNAFSLIDNGHRIHSDELRNAMVASEILTNERKFDVSKQLVELKNKYLEVRQYELRNTVHA